MKTCKDCAKRLIYQCDVHGEIPAHVVSKENSCQDFEPLADGEAELRLWLADAPPRTIEHGYITAMLDLMMLKPAPAFDAAVTWLYQLKPTKSVRAVRAVVDIFPVSSPI